MLRRLSPTAPVGLVSLPPEILLRIFRFFLDPRSISRLAQTCATLHDIAKSELIWKEIVLDLVNRHGVVEGESADSVEGDAEAAPSPSERNSWWDEARFLLPYANNLGYFASSIPFNSRVVRVSIVVPRHQRSTSYGESPPKYSIHAAQLRPFNAYSVTSPAPAHILPFGAHLEITLDSYNISRHMNSLHPDAEISTDLLSPRYDFSAAMIDVDREDGPLLSRPNSSTRQGVAVAALNSTSSTRESPRLRLRLSLDQVVQRVHGGSRPSMNLGGSAGPNAELSREALMALFSGRLPRTSWPTLELVGLEEVYDRPNGMHPHYPRRGTRRLRRGGNGAFRGMEDWLKGRGEERELAKIVERESNTSEGDGEVKERGDDQAFVTGFRLKAKRTATTPSPPLAPAPPDTEPPPTRRRGVGRDGGMAVLWNGAEEDPDETPAVTILRAGDQREGGVILHLDEEPHQRRPSPPTVPRRENTASPDTLADAVDAAGEAFFPIKPPAKQISWNDVSALSANGDVTASSLEGMWVGTYGSHGLEFVHLSTSFSASGVTSRPPTPPSETSPPTPPSPETYSRILTATKLTGDTNVPSGETTWIAFLDELPPSPSLEEILDGPVRSISKDKWNRMNRFDPSTSAGGGGRGRFSAEEWLEGTTKGVGQIALSGFLQPGWTSARVRFVRSLITLRRNRSTGEVRREKDEDDEGADELEEVFDEDEWETKEIESVEEIHLRWAELSKIAVFKRVRI